MSSSSSSSSDDENFLPPELLERERQLWERNQQLQNRVKHILESTDAALAESSSQEPIKPIEIPKFELSDGEDDDDIIPEGSILKSKRQNQISTNTPNNETNKPVKQTVKQTNQKLSPTPPKVAIKNVQEKTGIKKKIPEQQLIEVEVPQNVEPVIEVKYDPVPELRETLHKIAIEIEAVQRQIGEAKSSKTKAEVQVSKLQQDLKKAQVENQNAADDITIMTGQLEESKETITKLKNAIEAARLARIEKFQQQNELANSKTAIEAKIRKQRALAMQLQNQYSQMPQAEGLQQKLHADRQKKQKSIENEKKSLRSARTLLNEIEKACAHQQKIYEHLMLAKTSLNAQSPPSLSSDAIKRAIRDFIP